MAKTFKDHFSSRATDYAAYRPTYPPALVDWLAGLAGHHDLALDCGCGTGQLSAMLADRFARVVAVDASAEQIANAKPHDRVEYRQAPADRTGLADRSADLVTVAQAAHWFDLDAFYAEVRRVLKPGGPLALVTYGVIETDGEAGAVLSRFYHDVIAPYWPPERRHVETGYREMAFPFREETAPSFAMTAMWTVDELVGYVDTWSAVRNAEAKIGRAPVERFAADLRAAWGGAGDRREIRWPLSIRAGRVGV
ncbi:class I SAM-dependent methyltransferase [Kaustia mangrovi]|uniref:Class I SAM-dependent methyltransferase n=2 Tax=Kaustia mangrovi TaxID=2593653 RepID=A0A7S8C8H1_9HYPH|nr:class I SAM-dependent methyltransferase [Kaustia mangrovi]